MNYRCPAGGQENSELLVYVDHTEEHIVDLLKHDHPEWIEEDGVCKQCLAYYRAELRAARLKMRRVFFTGGKLKVFGTHMNNGNHCCLNSLSLRAKRSEAKQSYRRDCFVALLLGRSPLAAWHSLAILGRNDK